MRFSISKLLQALFFGYASLNLSSCGAQDYQNLRGSIQTSELDEELSLELSAVNGQRIFTGILAASGSQFSLNRYVSNSVISAALNGSDPRLIEKDVPIDSIAGARVLSFNDIVVDIRNIVGRKVKIVGSFNNTTNIITSVSTIAEVPAITGGCLWESATNFKTTAEGCQVKVVGNSFVVNTLLRDAGGGDYISLLGLPIAILKHWEFNPNNLLAGQRSGLAKGDLLTGVGILSFGSPGQRTVGVLSPESTPAATVATGLCGQRSNGFRDMSAQERAAIAASHVGYTGFLSRIKSVNGQPQYDTVTQTVSTPTTRSIQNNLDIGDLFLCVKNSVNPKRFAGSWSTIKGEFYSSGSEGAVIGVGESLAILGERKAKDVQVRAGLSIRGDVGRFYNNDNERSIGMVARRSGDRMYVALITYRHRDGFTAAIYRHIGSQRSLLGTKKTIGPALLPTTFESPGALSNGEGAAGAGAQFIFTVTGNSLQLLMRQETQTGIPRITELVKVSDNTIIEPGNVGIFGRLQVTPFVEETGYQGTLPTYGAGYANFSAVEGEIRDLPSPAILASQGIPPNLPQEFVAKSGDKQIRLHWRTGYNGTTSFLLATAVGNRPPTSCVGGLRIVATEGVQKFQYNDNNLKKKEQRSYRLCAVNNGGSVSEGVTVTGQTIKFE